MKAFPEAVKSWLDAGLGFFYPENCQLCQSERATADEGYVGANCRAAVRWIEPPFCECCGLPYEGAITSSFECSNCREMQLHFEYARAAAVADAPLLHLIHRYKYQRELWFEPFLAGLLLQAAGPLLQTGNWNMIVPVPLHRLKHREREFNQAERLGRCLSRATGLPLQARWLQRVQPTHTQTLLTRAQRAENVRRAFRVRPGLCLEGQRVVVIDDVLTTGATTSACAKALLEAGASAVCVWTVARGL